MKVVAACETEVREARSHCMNVTEVVEFVSWICWMIALAAAALRPLM
jgi:hypothetical protein